MGDVITVALVMTAEVLAMVVLVALDAHVELTRLEAPAELCRDHLDIGDGCAVHADDVVPRKCLGQAMPRHHTSQVRTVQ